jgi:hypothetical protein
MIDLLPARPAPGIRWKSKFGGMNASEAQRLQALGLGPGPKTLSSRSCCLTWYWKLMPCVKCQSGSIGRRGQASALAARSHSRAVAC